MNIMDLPKGKDMTSTLVPTTANVDGKDLSTVLKSLTAQKAEEAAEVARTPAKTVQVSQHAKDALTTLSELLSATELPTERRSLTQAEQQALMRLGVDSKAVKAAVEEAVSAVKEAVFNHLDVRLEEATLLRAEDVNEIPWDEKNGHYLVKGELPVEGTGKKFVRQLSEGEPVVPVEGLKRLWDEGKISRATYYRITRKPEVPREVDEEGLLDELKAHPELLETLGEIVVPGNVSASMYIRDVKTK